MVDDRAEGDAHDGDRWGVFEGRIVCLGKYIDVFRVVDAEFNLAPCGLGVSNVSTAILTDLVLSVADLTSSQHGPMIFRFTANSSNAEVLVPKTWLKVAPVVPMGISGSAISAARIGPLTIKPVHHLHPL